MYVITYTLPSSGRRIAVSGTPSFATRAAGLAWLAANVQALPHPARQYGCWKLPG